MHGAMVLVLVLVLLAAAGCAAQSPAGRPAGGSCLTADSYLGDCRPAGSCLDGDRSASCGGGHLCCTRFTESTAPHPAAPLLFPDSVRPTAQPRRPSLRRPQFECAGPKGPEQRRRRRQRRTTDTTAEPVVFVVGGKPAPADIAVGTGVVSSSSPRKVRPSLNSVLARLSFAGPKSTSARRPSPVSAPGPLRTWSRVRRPWSRHRGPGPGSERHRPRASRLGGRRHHQPRRFPRPRGRLYQPRDSRRLGHSHPVGSPRHRHRRAAQTEPAGFADVWREYQQKVLAGTARAGVSRGQLLQAYRAAVTEAERSGDAAQSGWTCGGALISERYMLTAAHCLLAGTPQVVRLGDRVLGSSEDGGTPAEYRVVRVTPHPDYSTPMVYHDLALLQLDRAVTFGPHVKPLCLYDGPANLTGVTSYVSGWGATEFGGGFTDTLQGGELPIWSRERCDGVYSSLPGQRTRLPNGITTAIVCAGGDDKDACQGDSGGPLTVLTERGTRLAAIVMGGLGCATPGVPGLYTSVAAHIDWIDSVVYGR